MVQKKQPGTANPGLTVLILILAISAAIAIPALGAAGGKGGGKTGGGGGGGGKGGGGSTTGGTYTLEPVYLDSTDGAAHWNQHIRFNASSPSTTEPHVSLKCYQAGTLVLTAQTGYYDGYPWPWTQTMQLSSGAWTGGGADCTATLYYFSGTRTVTLGSIPVTVLA